VGRATALLAGPRVLAFAVVAASVGVYYAWSTSLPGLSLWGDVAFLAFVLIPAVFCLVYLALPLQRAHGLLLLGLAFGVLTFAFVEADLNALANFAKLAATTSLAFWFVTLFDAAVWVGLVALLVPWVDAYSVWRGPTGNIVQHHRNVFTDVSFAFPVPGEHDAARLGPPDLFFFAFYLAAAAHFELRVRLTALCLALSLGATIAIAVALDSSGLPALPGLSLGFLLPNADLLWRQFSEARRSGRSSRSDRAREPGP
jgi:hypothetical protein